MGEISLQSDPLISVYTMYIEMKLWDFFLQVFKIIFQTNEIFIAFFIQVLAHLPNTKHFLSFLPTPTQHYIIRSKTIPNTCFRSPGSLPRSGLSSLYSSSINFLFQSSCDFEYSSWQVVLYGKVCQTCGRWVSMDTLVSSTNKTDHHDITEILLKVALNTITLASISISS